jgi:hypothetical protein
MINLGLIDLLLLLVLFFSLLYSLRMHNLLPIAAMLIIILLNELERLAPGTMTTLGKAIHNIDAINEQLPHIRISPIITIQS